VSGRVIAVTGVSRGLGRELFRGLAEAGHVVVGCARSPESEDIAAVDVADDAAVAAWAADAIARHGPPDLLINNAALMNRPAPLWDVPAVEFDALLRVNVGGVASAIRHFAPAMIAAGRGVIANLSSGWGRSASAEVGPYCATKWAVEGLTRALAAELRPGLAAVAVNPGIIDTDMLRTCWGGAAAAYPSPARWAERAVPFFLRLGPGDNGRSVDIPA
jgi:NAD(P)-dependent dehydrogenase (short-subunit alcohol dehydrogenase family)